VQWLDDVLSASWKLEVGWSRGWGPGGPAVEGLGGHARLQRPVENTGSRWPGSSRRSPDTLTRRVRVDQPKLPLPPQSLGPRPSWPVRLGCVCVRSGVAGWVVQTDRWQGWPV
jgi:hypothetical protein